MVPIMSFSMKEFQIGVSPIEDMAKLPANTYVEAARRDRKGQILAQNEIPSLLYHNDYSFRPNRLTKPVMWGDHRVVSERVADVMRGFDLGKGALVPVTIANWDGSERCDAKYYVLNVGNCKFARQGKSGSRLSERSDFQQHQFTARENDKVELMTQALEGPDIWHDPYYLNSVFVSAALGEALRAENNRQIFMVRVKVTTVES